MKTILLHIEDRVFNDLKNEIIAKKLACSFGAFISDQAVEKIIKEIEMEHSEYTLKYKGEGG